MRRPLMPALFAVALLTPLPALADDPSCPPGSWFCADPSVDTPPRAPARAPADEDDAPALPSARPQATPDETTDIDQDRAPTRRPHVVVVEEEDGGDVTPPNVVIVTKQRKPRVLRRAPTRLMPAPPQGRPQPKLYSKWGFNLRVQGAAMGDGAHPEAGIGGVGMSLRYRPVPSFGFDLGIDVIGGKDWNGFTRIETPASLNAMIFVNPRSRVQFYLMGGAHLSQAQVRSDTNDARFLSPTEGGKFGADYTYFGGQGGAGLEFRLGRRVGLSFDALAFIRKRTDDNPKPEFIDPETGKTTNTSAGVLFRGGLNFWW